MDRSKQIEIVEMERADLQKKLDKLISIIGLVQIVQPELMPFGWRKAAKGRTVWRILEEIISQNLEKNCKELGFAQINPSDSEVGVYDFEFKIDNRYSYVNIKSSVVGGKINKDDISKADKLIKFYNEDINRNLYIAKFGLRFNDNMTILIEDCVVYPIAWIPDIYINPSNNGNLQSLQYRYLDKAIKRTNKEFYEEINKEYSVAMQKKKNKIYF